jgi:crotonobetainyl-CoA:carnitine CoA-transferase CaiB-like acyl-CoA transferase
MVAAYMPERWMRFCRAIEHPELAFDVRFDTNTKRLSARSELTGVIESILVERSTAEWVSILESADVMCAPVLEYDDLLNEVQLRETEALWQVEHPTAGDIPALRYPAQLGTNPAAPQPLATHHLGEHSIDILTDWGFSNDEASEYLAAGVITQSGPILDNTRAKENQDD